MRLTLILLLSIIFGQSQVISAQDVMPEATYKQAEQKMWWNTSNLTDRMYVGARWQEDNSFWYAVQDQGEREYVLYNPKTKKRFVTPDRVKLFEKLPSKDEAVEALDNELLSPDETKAIYIEDWNLWMRDVATDTRTQLTTDGIENFGYATDNAGWRKSEYPVLSWSPDSKKIATYQQDQRHVSDMFMVKTVVGSPTLSEWKYPLPGDEDIIRIHRIVIDLDTKDIVRFKMDSDPRRGTLCDDITCSGEFDDNYWNEDGSKLAFVSSSRDHKVAQLRIADTKTGEIRDVHREEVATQYESGQGAINWKYFPKSDEFIWYSEKDNWGHLYLHDLKTGVLKNQITSGDYVVTRVRHIDEKKRTIYFEANGKEAEEDPYFTHLYKVKFDGSGLKLLTPESGHHIVSFSKDKKYFVDNYSTPSTPPVSVLRTLDGKLIETLEKASINRLEAAGWNAPTSTITKSDDGRFDLYGLMFTPTNMQEGKKYPVINYIYPGPQGGGVGNRAFSPSRNDHNALAELGFVVIIIDGSCNPGRSKDFHDACYGDMSVNTLPDQIAGIKQLAEKHDFIDTDKVGVWGHSGGGFATASAMFKYPDFYDVGISESGNHDNRNYEDDWGERYNGLMIEDEEGLSNYTNQANQLHADKLKGKLMIAHGAMDDNVPVSNSYLVVDALIKANKDFDLVIFPNARHGYGADRNYMMRKRWDYFVTHLQGKTPPKEYTFQADKP